MFPGVRNFGKRHSHRRNLFRSCALAAPMWLAMSGPAAAVHATDTAMEARPHFDLRTRMTVDVDGAPNAYGPAKLPTLDYLRNAHSDGTPNSPIVGYLTR